MKKIALFISLIVSGTFALAQTVAVNGTITDQGGKPVPFAFIRDSQHSYATFSDSTGNFNLKADPSSQLIVAAAGHPAIQVPLTTPAGLKIALTGDSPAPTPPPNDKVFDAGGAVSNLAAAGGNISSINSGQEATQGNRFLFNKWVHGYTLAADGSITQNDSYLFNYNKLDGNVVFTTDGNGMHQTVRTEVNGFVLFDGNAQPYVFATVPAVDNAHYVQVLASGNKYKLYKVFGTKFIKSNFSTNGISSSGNKYDEYVDESSYFVVKVPDGQPTKLALKKKALKAAFPADADKVNKYFTDNDKDIDEAYLVGLADALNQ
jgi:hypothetical protein